MSDLPDYRHTYKDKRVDKAYRLYVDGHSSLRNLPAIAVVSMRTLSRYSKDDQWSAEQSDRANHVANGNIAAQVAATLPATEAKDIEVVLAEALASPDARIRIAAVQTRQRMIANDLIADFLKLYAWVKHKAKENVIPAGQFMALVGLWEKLHGGERKANGMPDIMKLEQDSATGAAINHGDTIRASRAKRLAAAEKAAIETAVVVSQEHGPN